MKEPKLILTAVDLSDYSLPSIQYAHMLAHIIGAKLILVNIYNERDIRAVKNTLNAYYDENFFDKMVEENMRTRREQITMLVEQAGAQDSISDIIVRIGIPYKGLMSVIEEEKPDLLVMATKGRSNLTDTIIGSCASKMYRHSPIPVLSLRPNILK